MIFTSFSVVAHYLLRGWPAWWACPSPRCSPCRSPSPSSSFYSWPASSTAASPAVRGPREYNYRDGMGILEYWPCMPAGQPRPRSPPPHGPHPILLPAVCSPREYNSNRGWGVSEERHVKKWNTGQARRPAWVAGGKWPSRESFVGDGSFRVFPIRAQLPRNETV